jgi:phage shock protein PspC (stress-responsive transcriptional regulator)
MTDAAAEPLRGARPIRPRLTRSALDRVFGGVCGGVGAHLGVNAWVVRSAVVVLTVAMPALGILSYLFAWIVFPSPTLSDLPGADRPRPARPEATILLGGAVIGMGLLALAAQLGFLRGTQGDLLTPSLLALIGLAFLARQGRRGG